MSNLQNINDGYYVCRVLSSGKLSSFASLRLLGDALHKRMHHWAWTCSADFFANFARVLDHLLFFKVAEKHQKVSLCCDGVSSVRAHALPAEARSNPARKNYGTVMLCTSLP